MIEINKIRNSQPKIIILGNHVAIVQSILDFDYLSDKHSPSVLAIISSEDGYSKYFWGSQELLIPTFVNIPTRLSPAWFLNLLSGRRALSATKELIMQLPDLLGGVLFAENVPEKHTLELFRLAQKRDLLLIGPASVGFIIPGMMKLGPIAGVTPEQIETSGILNKGDCAVISASGGMTNELINLVKQSGRSLSFAFSTGGDRFPMPTITQAFQLAQTDSQTKTIIYYGELGGVEEYELIKMKNQGRLTKPVIAHIAGTVADLFPESPQFGHAKAKANANMEKATEKRKALSQAGFLVSQKFNSLLELIKQN